VKPIRLVAALALVLLASCTGGDPQGLSARCPKPSGLISIGEPIPGGCQLERLNGGLLRLADLKGKPAVINFWATWCTFCIDEMPAIEAASLPLRNRVAVIGADLLNVDGETRGAAESFAKKTGVTYDLVYDRGGILFGNFSGQLLLPVTIFVKPNGIVAYRQFGPLTESTLTALITKHLGVR
jgi:cytochrome c biogenesis protein CcmG, thiol:disulfide interchange protein DsbE